jgi:hypothetical protein
LTVDIHLISKKRISLCKLGFLVDQETFFILNRGDNTGDLDVQSGDLFPGLLDFEMLIHECLDGWLCPRAALDISAQFPEKIKVRQECILDHLFPSQGGLFWSHGFSSHIVALKHTFDCL